MLEECLGTWPTPFYLSAWPPCRAQHQAIDELLNGLPVKHWLSLKTQPLRPLLQEWRKYSGYVEVVSEYELLAALKEHYPPENILINGVGKYVWLQKYSLPHATVILDSLREIEELSDIILKQHWRVGLRLNATSERDPDCPSFGTQFGFDPADLEIALWRLSKADISPSVLHFHLRSNIKSVQEYFSAFNEILGLANSIKFFPRIIDIGGGLPVDGEFLATGEPTTKTFLLTEYRFLIEHILASLPSVQEIWLENGRFLTASSSILALSVLDSKEIRGTRFLICDGGRTNHALISDWERHHIHILPSADGPLVQTTICGPTCMAYDLLVRCALPRDVDVGHIVVWMNAGAYHIPWETHFSHGLCAILWSNDGKTVSCVRPRQDFCGWWRFGGGNDFQ